VVRTLDRIRRVFFRILAGRSTPGTSQTQQDSGIEDEVDYFALANYLIDHYGPDAKAQAVRFTHEALQKNDSLEVADWQAVEQAIGLLTNECAGARH
jgi:hypothetical protein